MKYFYKHKPVELGSRLSIKGVKEGRSIEFFTTSLDESDAEFLCDVGLLEKRVEKKKTPLTFKDILLEFAEERDMDMTEAIALLALIPLHARLTVFMDIAARLIDRRYKNHIKDVEDSQYYYFEPALRKVVSVAKKNVKFGKKGLFRNEEDAQEAVNCLDFLIKVLYE